MDWKRGIDVNSSLHVSHRSRTCNEQVLSHARQEIRRKIHTHQGSVELQNQLDRDHLCFPSILFREIERDLTAICVDTYGNYVCQKLLRHLSDAQLAVFLDAISGSFLEMATSLQGSCVIHALLHVAAAKHPLVLVSPPPQVRLLSEFRLTRFSR